MFIRYLIIFCALTISLGLMIPSAKAEPLIDIQAGASGGNVFAGGGLFGRIFFGPVRDYRNRGIRNNYRNNIPRCTRYNRNDPHCRRVNTRRVDMVIHGGVGAQTRGARFRPTHSSSSRNWKRGW